VDQETRSRNGHRKHTVSAAAAQELSGTCAVSALSCCSSELREAREDEHCEPAGLKKENSHD